MTNLRTLFVDDEPARLEGARNQYPRERERWNLSFAIGGEEAITLMRAHPSSFFGTLASVVERDSSQSAKVLQLVNSANAHALEKSA